GWATPPAEVSYSGHGAPFAWGAGLFTIFDIPSLPAQALPPVVLQLDCFSSAAHMTGPMRSLGELLVVTPDRGATATIGSVALTPPSGQTALARAYLSARREGATVGAAFLAAQQAVRAKGYPDVLRTFVLFGDPTTR
ncbi:MAG: C25 family cysteine peptidase, partial [Planctomycetota bacterium]